MLKNRRWGKRFKSRIKARYGLDEYTHFGYLDDLSVFGFFLKTTDTFPSGSVLKVQIMTPQRDLVTLHGNVQWERHPHTSMVWIANDAGMGIKISRFLNGQEHYEALCNHLCKNQTTEREPYSPPELPLKAKKKEGLLRKLFRRR